MLMVIFGAGASYDSMPSHPASPRTSAHHEELRPPLASQLFENRAQFAAALKEFPDCHAIIPWLRNPQGVTLEAALQQFQDGANSYPARYSQLAAVRYYLQQMLYRCGEGWKHLAMGITNYKSLLGMVEEWRQSRDESVCLVTFNYDTLLEDALPSIGFTINGIGDYVAAHPRYILVKLHGSVTWSREVDFPTDFRLQGGPQSVRQELIRRAAEVKVSNRYIHENPYTIGLHDGKVVFPAIAIPVETKSQFECPDEHIDILRSKLPKVRKVLIVGWRAAEQHFLKLLSEHLCGPLEVVVVEGSNAGARTVESQLQPIIGERVNGGIQSVSGGFTGFVVGRRAIPFLEAIPRPSRSIRLE